MKPTSVNILGKTYSIVYVDKPSEVDIFKRESCWGQIDYWTRSIRVYDHQRTDADILETILHEVIHGLVEELKLKSHIKDNDAEYLTGLLALGLADVLTRNGWLKTEAAQ